jgi:hypothetical protein
MRALKINPVQQTVEEVLVPSDSMNDIRTALEAAVAAHAIFLPSKDSMYVNPHCDEDMPTFFFNGFPPKEIRGHAVIVFSDNKGHHDAKARLEDVKSLVQFLEPSKSL